MKQLLQDLSSHDLRVEDLPSPRCLPGGVLVRNVASLISSGTERASVHLAGKSLLGKAAERPDLVRQVFEHLRRDGLSEVLSAVRARFDADLPLGYSSSGIVLEAGEGAEFFTAGDRVACAGAGHASHAEIIWVPKQLCTKVPEGVDFESAAAGAVGAIALQGVRVADVKIGEHVAVIGLGLVGLLTSQILKAAGCTVWGIDIDPERIGLATAFGVDFACENRDVDAGLWNHTYDDGKGADSVIVTAATSSSEPVELAGRLARDRGIVVIVGDVRVDVPRDIYYKKELQLRYSRSYGPGRYDPAYEESGVDYPYGFVRWTEKRNLQAFLELVAAGKVRVGPLITHRFPIERATEAYKLLAGQPRQKYVGIALNYPPDSSPSSRVFVSTAGLQIAKRPNGRSRRSVRMGWIGAGTFSRANLLPQLRKIRGVECIGLANAGGVSARRAAIRFGFRYCCTDAHEILADPTIDAVSVATRHDLHADLVVAALRGGKHVFVEKPLCVNEEELQRITSAYRATNRVLLVGFNRRFSPFARECQHFFAGRTAPLSLLYRVNAGRLPHHHWVLDPLQGHGRIIGEVCHFVDLVQFLASAPPVSVQAWHAGACPQDDLHIHLSMADGSQAEIVYLCSADRSIPKERLELSAEGRTAVCEDFHKWRFHLGGRRRTVRLLRRDKGHRQELRAFIQTVAEGGEPPISFESIRVTTLTTFRIRESLSSGTCLPVKAQMLD